MFFQIKGSIDLTFPTHIRLTDHLWLNADDGWSIFVVGEDKVIFKGYLDNQCMSDDVACDLIHNRPTLTGNFIALLVLGATVTIFHDRCRSFGLFIDDDNCIIHNMPLHVSRRVPPEMLISVADDFNILYAENRVSNEFSEMCLNKDDAIDLIDNILVSRFTQFMQHNTLPVNIFVSGGIDTVLCWAYLKKVGSPYWLLTSATIFNSKFIQNHGVELDKFWAYSQICSTEEPSVLVSGAMGDEVMMRGPMTSNWLAAFNDKSLNNMLTLSHYHFYHHTSHINLAKYKEEYRKFDTYYELKNQIINATLNDHQHWHLDNTITFTPFKDISILQILLQLPFSDLLGQLLDAEISKELVRRNSPELLECIDKYKNQRKYLGVPIYHDKFLQFK